MGSRMRTLCLARVAGADEGTIKDDPVGDLERASDEICYVGSDLSLTAQLTSECYISPYSFESTTCFMQLSHSLSVVFVVTILFTRFHHTKRKSRAGCDCCDTIITTNYRCSNKCDAGSCRPQTWNVIC